MVKVKPLAWRILSFNLLLVFLPALGFFYLDSYEKQLLVAQERSMVQQGRFAAAALEGSLLTQQGAQSYLLKLRQRHEARIRILDEKGKLLADSSSLGPNRILPEVNSPTSLRANYDQLAKEILPQDSLLYRLAIAPIRFWRRYIRVQPSPVPMDFDGLNFGEALEVQAALKGQYGARTRVLGLSDPSVYLYSALPILGEEEQAVQGVVLVSQSTFRILINLYELRLDNLRFVLLGALAALILTLITSWTVIRPLRELSIKASTLMSPEGRLLGVFPTSKANHEIGLLTRSLHELSSKLNKQMAFIESFSQDLSHELKNPLSSMAAALEILQSTKADSKQGDFLGILDSEVQRMFTMIHSLRQLSLVDSGLENSGEGCEPEAVLRGALNRLTLRFPQLTFSKTEKPLEEGLEQGSLPLVALREGVLAQVLDNLLDNAAGFHRGSEALEVVTGWVEGAWKLAIRDQGPGFPPEDAQKIFDRFYSSRKNDNGLHTGLGLAVVKAIVEGCGGTIRAENANPGAIFRLSLPRT